MALSSPVLAPATDALTQLLDLAAARKPMELPYGGEVTSVEAYEYLRSYPALLIDVRTQSEWAQGVPNISKTQGKLITLSWKLAPNYAQNESFLAQLAGDYFIDRETPLFFICRSGGRSLDAAIAAQAAGYRYCFNVAGGFEGQPGITGWKLQLPWTQG